MSEIEKLDKEMDKFVEMAWCKPALVQFYRRKAHEYLVSRAEAAIDKKEFVLSEQIIQRWNGKWYDEFTKIIRFTSENLS